MRQHLTAVNGRRRDQPCRSATGRQSVPRGWSFGPGKVESGNYTFSVGTAGSATLVLQTVLPALLLAEGESNLTLEGGTHNPFAPPLDFLAKGLSAAGRTAWGRRSRSNWFGPVSIRPAADSVGVASSQLANSGGWNSWSAAKSARRRVRAIVANLPRHIAERECRAIAEKTGWDEVAFKVEEASDCAGRATSC